MAADSEMMGVGMEAPGSIGSFSHELAMLEQLKEEGFITEPEWVAKKAQVLGRGCT